MLAAKYAFKSSPRYPVEVECVAHSTQGFTAAFLYPFTITVENKRELIEESKRRNKKCIYVNAIVDTEKHRTEKTTD